MSLVAIAISISIADTVLYVVTPSTGRKRKWWHLCSGFYDLFLFLRLRYSRAERAERWLSENMGLADWARRNGFAPMADENDRLHAIYQTVTGITKEEYWAKEARKKFKLPDTWQPKQNKADSLA